MKSALIQTISRYFFASFITVIGVYSTSFAQEHRDNIDAHVHGLSEMTIAIEGKTLEIEITSPANNLVGFEHKATTETDIAAVENALSILKQHDSIISFTQESACTLQRLDIDSSSLLDSHHASNEEHGHHDNAHHDNKHHDGHEHNESHVSGHSEKHDHEHEDDHGSKHNDEHEHNHEHKGDHSDEHSSHSEIVAHYHYQCNNTGALSEITINLFDMFSGIEKIQALWVTETKQGSTTLSAKNNRLNIK